MEGAHRPIWFAGDLGDPWVAGIAGALPPGTRRLDCPADLPEAWPGDGPAPEVVVLHRATLHATDAQRVVRLRGRSEPPARVILCVGPHARAADIERWARLVDVILPEATARETVAHHASGPETPPRPPGPRPRVAVVAAGFELRTTLAEACRAGGYPAEPAVDWPDAAPGLVAIWDVPILEAGWPEKLARRARVAPVVALLGFADRATVDLARAHGASACLDLPCEVADLLNALDRVTSARIAEPARVVPPPHLGKIHRTKAPR